MAERTESQQEKGKAPAERDYLVYEVSDGGKTLTMIGQARAKTEREARWQAIEASEEHRSRAIPEPMTEAPGVLCVAITARAFGEPVLTREEPRKGTVRR